MFGWPDIQQTLKLGGGGGGIFKSLYATQAGHSLQNPKGLHNCLEFSQHSCVYIRLCKHRKSFSTICLNTETCGQNYFHIFSVKGNTSLKQTRRSMNNIGINFFFIISDCRNVG